MRHLGMLTAAIGLAAIATVPAGAEDAGRKACFADAKRLCPAQVNAFKRKAVEACMIQRIDETSPTCHATMLAIRDQRQAKRR
jgi:hypothetical protein